MEMSDILRECIKRGASDIHISAGRPVTLRIHGELVPIEEKVLAPEDTEVYMKAMTSDLHRQKIETIGGVDFGFAFSQQARFRASIFRQKGSYGVVLRQIPNRLMTFEQIGLSSRITELLYKPRGLVLVVGPTGSGKTTTLATMVNYINENRSTHIITIEDPIEYFHEHKRSIITQREVGVDVPSFHEALIKALRQDPDVILVGEMRDLATMEAAITAAETGHLVFATLHTTGAARTVDRIIDAFPSHQQEQIRTQLASSMIAVVSQLLIPKVTGDGRVACFEIMITTPAISNLIRENKTYRITSDIQTGGKFGMKTLDSSLLELYSSGTIAYEEMISKCYDLDQVAVQAAQIKAEKKSFFAKKVDDDKKKGWLS
jgi:twitching motility protein PilT